MKCGCEFWNAERADQTRIKICVHLQNQFLSVLAFNPLKNTDNNKSNGKDTD